MTERVLDRPETTGEEGLYSRRYLVSVVSIAAVMFLTGFAALAVIPLLPVAALDLDGVALYPLVAGCFVAASLVGGVLGAALAQYAASGWDLAHLWFAFGGLAILATLAPRLLPARTWRAGRGLPATVLLRALASGTFFTIEVFVPVNFSVMNDRACR